MAPARTLNRDPQFLGRFRTLTIGFLTPLHFLRADSLVSLPELAGAPPVVLALLGMRLLVKTGVPLPVFGRFREVGRERWYTSLLMSTGLRFGTIAAIYGRNHGIITPGQYSLIVASVIGSAVVPTSRVVSSSRHTCCPKPQSRARRIRRRLFPRRSGRRTRARSECPLRGGCARVGDR
jgi:Kef-type K+ transport system membrane component KefB